MSIAVSRASAPTAPEPLDVEQLRQDFPALHQEIHGHPLVYLDSAASAQKPQAVLDALLEVYSREYSNVHRGVHALSQRATQLYEKARETARAFLGAASTDEILFVRGTTEGINLVAQCYARPRLGPGDEVVLSAMEHHSNIVPWQMVCEAAGASLHAVPINSRGELDLDAYEDLLNERTRLVAMVHVSNALGTINPAKDIVRMARERGIATLLDGAQAAPHMAIDVQDLGVDFYAISGHKLFGPTGIGVLYGRRELLASMPPYQGGGDMIRTVSFEKTEYAEPPHRFEAGTPHIAGAVGLGAAMDYVTSIGLEAIGRHERRLLEYANQVFADLPSVQLIGTAREKASVLSFLVDGVHAHDVGTILDRQGIAVRVGHHCAQPVMDHFGVAATVRASMAFYNTTDEIDRLAAGIRQVLEIFN